MRVRAGEGEDNGSEVLIGDGEEFNLRQEAFESVKAGLRLGGVSGLGVGRDVVEDEACEGEFVGGGQGLDGLFVKLGGAHGRIIPNAFQQAEDSLASRAAR